MSKIPFVSIIIVNYNGKHYLEECIQSLERMNFPKKNYEIIIIDNNSQDTSVEYVKKYFPDVFVVESQKNLGFADGCNLGASYAKGQYIALLNTDTKVDVDWLSMLVNRIRSDSQIAAVNSKILLYFPFLEISLKSDLYMRSEFTNSINFQHVGVLLENILLDDKKLQPLVRYSRGFYDKEKGSISARWTKGDAVITIPYDPRRSKTELTLTLRSEKSSTNLKTKVSLTIGNKILVEGNLKSYEVKQCRITLKKNDVKQYFRYAVQDAGVAVFKNGYGRDRGAVVASDSTCFYELENNFYQQPNEITAFCGASALIRKDLFNEYGGFDSSFFMYYEDVDMSLRFKRDGWKIYYEPHSIVYHIHAGTSTEGSSLFIFNVEKNHLALLIKHFPIMILIKGASSYLVLLIITILKIIKWRLKEQWDLVDELEEKARCRLRVIEWIIKNFSQLLSKRLAINKNSKINLTALYKKLY